MGDYIPDCMKFSVELDDEVMKLCEAEIKRLGALVRSRSHYIQLILSIRHKLVPLDALSAINESFTPQPKLPRASKSARS